MGSALHPAGEAYSSASDLVDGFEGPLHGRGGLERKQQMEEWVLRHREFCPKKKMKSQSATTVMCERTTSSV